MQNLVDFWVLLGGSLYLRNPNSELGRSPKRPRGPRPPLRLEISAAAASTFEANQSVVCSSSTVAQLDSETVRPKFRSVGTTCSWLIQ